MPYGRMPMYGGNIYMATGKTILKKGLPILKKIWGRMSADQKRALITGAVNVTARGALKVGDAVRGGLGKVSNVAEAKLGKLLGSSWEVIWKICSLLQLWLCYGLGSNTSFSCILGCLKLGTLYSTRTRHAWVIP